MSKVYPRGGMLVVTVQSRRRGIAPHKVSLAEVGCEDEAEAKRYQLVRALKDGTYRPPSQALTLAQFLAKYEAFYVAAAGPDARKARERTWRVAAGVQVRLALGWLATRQGIRTIREITSEHCERWKDDRLAADLALATVRCAKLACQAAWSWAQRHGYASVNPWRGMKFPRGKKKDPRNLSAMEARIVFPLALAEEGADLHARMALGLYAGLRLEETERLRQADLVWGDDGFIRLGPGKDGEPRTTIFPPELQAIMERFKSKGPIALVLGPCIYTRVEAGIRRLAARLAVPFTFRDLRKSFAGHLANELGVPVKQIADYLGHSSVKTTETYYVARNRADATTAARVSFGIQPAAGSGAGSAIGPSVAKAAGGSA